VRPLSPNSSTRRSSKTEGGLHHLHPTTTASYAQIHVGAARVSDSTTALLHVPPITADGIRPTDKVRRVNAGIILTLRAVNLRLWIVVSYLIGQWAIRWPAGVATLSAHSQYQSLATVGDSMLDAPHLDYRGPGEVPDMGAVYESLFNAIARAARADESPDSDS
jgi:hypothetical protein